MGLKKWAAKLKELAQQKKEDLKDPKKIQAQRVATATAAIKAAQTGNEIMKKVEGVQQTVTEKAAELAEKAGPLAEKIDNAAGTVTEQFTKVKDAVVSTGSSVAGPVVSKMKDAIVDGATKAVETVKKTVEQQQKDKADHPTSGSTLLDLVAGAVPENEVTKKAKKEDQPKPPAPPAP